MKRRTKLGLSIGVIFCLVLLPVMWKAAAPFRIRRQFEEQATEQLRGTTSLFKGKFQKLSVKSLQYNTKANRYDFEYTTSWFIPNSPYGNSSVVVGNKCSLKATQDGASGSCDIGIPLRDDKGQLAISVHE